MTKRCEKCGYEYTAGSFDLGLCPSCKPGFFGAPLWLQPLQAGTKSLWRTMLAIHILLFFLMCLSCGGESLAFYCLTIIVYFAVRMFIARFRGYPLLKKYQAIALFLLPAYGPFYFIALFHFAQRLRWGPM
ncbi:MAG: hypothetical protein NTY53_00685 [Kiritimatiellaeota bacterium]|nr:hypothetical protein [Kiritimatiellota bacterium]